MNTADVTCDVLFLCLIVFLLQKIRLTGRLKKIFKKSVNFLCRPTFVLYYKNAQNYERPLQL